MKNKTTILSIILLFLLSFQAKLVIGQSYPLQLTSFVKPPYPTKFEDWENMTNKIILNITNTTSNEYEVNLNLDITGPNGFNVHKQKILNLPIELSSHQTINLKGDNWDNYDMNLKIGDINPDNERNFVVKNRAFREGNYQICWQAVDKTGTNQLSEKSQGCYTFEVTYGEAPQIITPQDNSFVPSQNPSLVQVNWAHQVIGAPFEYTLKIIELTNSIPSDINEAMNNPGIPSFYEEDAIKGFSRIIRGEDFKKGTKYAIRVTSNDPNNKVYFKNAGHSAIVVFTYGEKPPSVCDNLNAFKITSYFPSDGDTLPFTSLPVIGQFSPECEDLRQIKNVVTFNGKKEKATITKWQNGPVKYLQDGFNDKNINWQMASKVPFVNKTLKRGEKYSWSVAIAIKDKKGKRYTSKSSKVSFVVGMSVPKLTEPTVDEKVGAGTITFEWKTPQRQSKLAPDFKLLFPDGKKTSLSKIDEHWVLQVFSKNDPGSTLAASGHGKISIDPNDYYNSSTHRYNTAALLSKLGEKINVELEIKKQGDYWWRVVWLKNPNGSTSSVSNSDIYHASSLRKFHVGAADNSDTQTKGECIASCDAAPITDKKATDKLKVNDTLKIGLFDLKVTKIDKSANKKFTGNGEIEIKFLNKMRVNVVFKDIQKNKNNQIFSGSVKAIKDVSYFQTLYKEYEKYAKYAKMGYQKGVEALKQKKLAAELELLTKNTERLVSSFSGLRATGMPIGIDKEIEGVKIVMVLTELEFGIDKATLQCVTSVKIPTLKIDTDSSNVLVFGTKDFCFSPNGLGSEGTAYLLQDMTIGPDSHGNKLKIIGGSKPSASHLIWDCKGFKNITVNLEYYFPRDIIVPDASDKSNVVAKATLVAKKGLNLMGKINIDDFQLPFTDMKGYVFKVTNAWIDLSDISNPKNLNANLPKNYKSTTLGEKDPRKSNLWRGFWLQEMTMTIPGYIGGNDKGGKTSVKVNNMIIDETGFSASFLVKDLIKWNDGKKVDGCAFSMDSIWVNVLQNNLSEAGLSGAIGAPFAKKDDNFIYRGVFSNSKTNGKSNPALTLTIKPKENTLISLPWIWAELHIKKTSIIKLKLAEKDSEVDFTLNAKVNIDSEKFKDKNIKSYAMKIPGIEINNLGYNSKTGFKSAKFVTSQASPQKWLAGFPLSLNEFKLKGGMKNPTISFSITLSLMDKKGKSKNAISAKTSLSIVTKFDGSKPFENIGIDKVKLDSLSIHAKFSGIGLDGSVAFYDDSENHTNKKGFKGKIAISLPANFGASLEGEFGTIKAENAKNQNTKEWYSYWRVYGKVSIGSGVPLFSGVSLYAIEGGAYHHMKYNAQDNTYTNDFNSILGLQFGVTIGSNDMGKAYNINAKIAAEISNDSKNGGGLQITIEGDIRILNKDLKDKSSKIRGKVKLVFGINRASDIREGDRYWVYSTIDVYINFGIIKGGMDSNNKMVQSTFYATFVPKDSTNTKKKQEGYWFFNMGTPKNRGKLKVNFETGDKKSKNSKNTKPLIDIVFTSYLMAGYDIPTTVPDPSPEFMTIWNELKDKKEKDEISDPKVDKFIKGKKLPELSPGEGFAFGAGASLNIEANPVPFYLKAGIAIGFDLQMTHNEKRTCAETSEHPGIDDWYASGQVYAGLHLTLGLAVKLWFINEKITLLDAKAAMLLNGGFPKPNWVHGEGRLQYSVLNNLIKGQYHFEIDVGQQCTFTTSTAGQLASLKFIQSVKPGDKSKKVDVFSECTVAFAIPVNREMKIPINKKVYKTIKPYIFKWELKNGSSIVPTEDILFNTEHTAATLSPKVMLEGKAKYMQYIEIRAMEYFSNGTKTLVKDKNKKIWSETSKTYFITDKAPTVIVDRNVLFTYPLKNQRSFLKKETENNQGYIVQRVGTGSLFRQKDKNYFARFTRIDGSDSYFEVPLTYEKDTSVISFNISGLDNDTYYSLQIIEQKPHSLKEFKDSDYEIGVIGYGGNLSEYNPLDKKLLGLKEGGETELLKGSKSTMKSNVIKRRELPGTQVRSSYERIIYHYYFKTSKYNSFKDKIANTTWSLTSYRKGLVLVLHSSIDESLEQYDVKGYKHNSYNLAPLVLTFLNNIKGKSENRNNNYPANNYVKDIIYQKILWPRDEILEYFKRRSIPFKLMKNINFNKLAKFRFPDTDVKSPISKSELNKFNNISSNSGNGVIQIGNDDTNYLGNIFSGINTSSNINGFQDSKVFKLGVYYLPKFESKSYLQNKVKPYFSKLIYSHIWFPKNYGMDRKNKNHLEHYKYYHVPSGHWWLFYFKNIRKTNLSPYLIDIDEYDTAYDKYIYDKTKDLSGPTIIKFINENYRHHFWICRDIDNLLEVHNKMDLDYPKDNSFILQYRYPAKESYKHYNSNKKLRAKMKNGTNYRVSFTK